ncbi:unnamed protein product [Leptidea sinapis]|uniref:Uncharacterized protein n=1 Tax=Leptidea sinapis TaxID=189913 RepID=A0A5E4Q0F2_9NEOP|nr:unnamed protein product [Leptidea sinapis]
MYQLRLRVAEKRRTGRLILTQGAIQSAINKVMDLFRGRASVPGQSHAEGSDRRRSWNSRYSRQPSTEPAEPDHRSEGSWSAIPSWSCTVVNNTKVE